MQAIVTDLLKKEETVWLEYKSFWYWDERDASNSAKGWGEFLKDFAALFNTYSKQKDEKYFIIGFDEHTKKCQNFNIDQENKEIKIFNDLQLFKRKIVSKLKNSFRNIPDYKESNELPGIESLFDIEVVRVDDKTEVLVFTIKAAPFLLELDKQLQGNVTFREGSIITRVSKKDGSPENANANAKKIEELLGTVESNKVDNFPEKDISIKKIVEVFQEKIAPHSERKHIKSETNYSSGICYEIYTLRGEYTSATDFIYFSKHTSQRKTLNYILENKLLEQTGTKIILVDKLNKDKGMVDKKRIEKLFQDEFSDIEVYYLEEFALKKLYNDLFDPDIFHNSEFDIKDFIRPYTDKSEDKDAVDLLNEWYRHKGEPLLVMKGMGGIGKTTVIKYFLDSLHKNHRGKDDTNILFINSHDIINEIMKNPKIEDIFDFYRITAEKNDIVKKFDKKLLQLSIDNGNMIIILDGLDEVIAKIGSKFDINRFIEAIFNDYSGNLEKAKILITCRDYFWDEHTQHPNIKTIALKPFDKKMTEQYFEFYFNDSPSKLKKAMSLATDFSKKNTAKGKVTYIPYILDMIKEGILMDVDSSEQVQSNILLKKDNINDFLVGKVCEREILKLDNLPIDEQINILIRMAVKYNGALLDEHFIEFESTFDASSQTNLINKFKSHPLLEFNNASGSLKFRYDFFNEYFKNIKLAIFLNKGDFEKIDEDIIEILIQHISYDGSLMKDLAKRLNDIDYEEFKISILELLTEKLYKIDNLDESKRKRLSSSLFILLLVLSPASNTEARTELLKELFEDEGEKNKIKNLYLINLHTSGADKPIFNFSDLKFTQCHFENYEYFTGCECNSDTFFTESIFMSPLHIEGVNPTIRLKNIDTNTCNAEGIIEVLQKSEKKLMYENLDIRINLKQIIKFFWSSSAFRQKSEAETRKKLRTHTRLIDILIKEKIIQQVHVHTKQKRHDTAYQINSEYSNLRKIMEENYTCSEFEKIVSIVEGKH